MNDFDIRRAVTHARKTIEEVLDGEQFGADLDEAIATLSRHDPEYYELLRSRHSSAPTDHRALLDDMAREVHESWLELSRRLAREASGERLLAVYSKKLRAWIENAAAGLEGWTLQPVAVARLGTAPEARLLTIPLPEGQGELRLHIQPQADHWMFLFTLPEDSPLQSLVVGVGDETSPLYGSRTILRGRDARIAVDAQPGKRFSIHLQWQTEHAAVLPLPIAMEE